MRKIDTLIIHCTATRPSWFEDKTAKEKTAEVRRWHVEERDWKDIGYHVLIDRDGTVINGRPLDQVGAHAIGHNRGSIGIALFGGHGGSSENEFEENYTLDQDTALRKIISDFKSQYPNIDRIIGHNEVANKACPCFEVTSWRIQKPQKEPRKKLTSSKTIQASQITKMAGIATPLVGSVSGLDWPHLLILSALALIILVATGVIDLERVKKWHKGDR
jgi:hypothetical protein|tara:strand:- start:10444 stop:11097 length:654 start_codon:yes stop_codon:yes gene_type:complete